MDDDRARIRVEARIKRGTGTRDQDDFSAVVRADDPDEARERMDAVLDHAEREWLPRMRENFQPEEYGPRVRECEWCGDSRPLNSRWAGEDDVFCTTECWQEAKAAGEGKP